MTDHPDHVSAPEGAYAAIDALVDGRPVQPGVLRDALANPDARDYFVDALVLRQMTRDVDGASVTSGVPSSLRTGFMGRARWLAAGVVLALCTATGFAIGQERGARAVDAAESGAFVEVQTVMDFEPQAPSPTRVIRLTPGVNWTSATEGR
jgi:hypothetical protein